MAVMDKKGETPSYGELAAASELISDEDAFAEYADVEFTDDDFCC